jgi:monofunctional glycosyltransferase
MRLTNPFVQISDDLRTITRGSTLTQGKLSDFEVIVLLLEDRRFFRHNGIDLRAAVRELLKMITLRPFGGASTIDMQFVRTRTGYRALTFQRKAYEMFLAVLLQRQMTKRQILRTYLKDVYLGYGLTGVDSACRIMFNKDQKDLTHDEAATIAAMMVYPRPATPTSIWSARVHRRAAYGLRLLRRYGENYRR